MTALLSGRATARPGVSISDDPSSINELVAVVLVTDANHVTVGIYTLFDREVGDQVEFYVAISEIRS